VAHQPARGTRVAATSAKSGKKPAVRTAGGAAAARVAIKPVKVPARSTSRE
jgi:hypothetical protein